MSDAFVNEHEMNVPDYVDLNSGATLRVSGVGEYREAVVTAPPGADSARFNVYWDGVPFGSVMNAHFGWYGPDDWRHGRTGDGRAWVGVPCRDMAGCSLEVTLSGIDAPHPILGRVYILVPERRPIEFTLMTVDATQFVGPTGYRPSAAGELKGLGVGIQPGGLPLTDYPIFDSAADHWNQTAGWRTVQEMRYLEGWNGGRQVIQLDDLFWHRHLYDKLAGADDYFEVIYSKWCPWWRSMGVRSAVLMDEVEVKEGFKGYRPDDPLVLRTVNALRAGGVEPGWLSFAQPGSVPPPPWQQNPWLSPAACDWYVVGWDVASHTPYDASRTRWPTFPMEFDRVAKKQDPGRPMGTNVSVITSNAKKLPDGTWDVTRSADPWKTLPGQIWLALGRGYERIHVYRPEPARFAGEAEAAAPGTVVQYAMRLVQGDPTYEAFLATVKDVRAVEDLIAGEQVGETHSRDGLWSFDRISPKGEISWVVNCTDVPRLPPPGWGEGFTHFRGPRDVLPRAGVLVGWRRTGGADQ